MIRLIKALRGLFRSGACPASDADPGPSLTPLLGGLAHPSEDGSRWVMSRRLLGLRQELTTDDEAVAAILAHDRELRSAWARILAARCREAGLLLDANTLAQLVSRLDGAATWVETAMAEGSLAPTASAHVERELLGATAEQARTTPALVRVMAAASVLDRWRPAPLPALAPVDLTGERVDTNWCAGRLLALPGAPDCDSNYLLNGTWGGDVDGKAVETPQNWFLPNPWPLLLAAVGYVQDAWAAEARGGLLLELPPGQNPHHPSEVQVLVAGADGAELLCGSLGVFAPLREFQFAAPLLAPKTPVKQGPRRGSCGAAPTRRTAVDQRLRGRRASEPDRLSSDGLRKPAAAGGEAIPLGAGVDQDLRRDGQRVEVPVQRPFGERPRRLVDQRDQVQVAAHAPVPPGIGAEVPQAQQLRVP